MSEQWFHYVVIEGVTFLNGRSMDARTAELLMEADWHRDVECQFRDGSRWVGLPSWKRALSAEEIGLVAEALREDAAA